MANVLHKRMYYPITLFTMYDSLMCRYAVRQVFHTLDDSISV